MFQLYQVEGGGSERFVVIEVPVIINQRKFGRAVNKVALEDIGIPI